MKSNGYGDYSWEPNDDDPMELPDGDIPEGIMDETEYDIEND
jgi:hypothetical protein